MSTTGFLQLEVDAPAFRSSAYGLLATAQTSDDAGLRPLGGGSFLSGAAQEPSGALVTSTGAGACDPLDNATVPKDQNITDVWLDAFVAVIFGWWQCAPVGYSFEEAQAAARGPFLNGEQRAIEKLLWDGVFTDAACTAAASQLDALAQAEQAIADNYGGEGLIHMSRTTATLLGGTGPFTRVGSNLRTVAAYTPVVVGDGYGDHGTIAATGPIKIVRGELADLTPDAVGIRRGTNVLTAVLERAYLIEVDAPVECFTFTPGP